MATAGRCGLCPMTTNRVFLVVAALAGALAACSHAITLRPQDGIGPVGQGTAAGSLSSSGKLTVALEGKTYAGEWVYQPQGGTIGFGTAYSGTSVATGTMFGAPMSGGGMAHLSEPGGSSLRCQFTYSDWSGTGVGQCQRNDGKLYDMVIK